MRAGGQRIWYAFQRAGIDILAADSRLAERNSEVIVERQMATEENMNKVQIRLALLAALFTAGCGLVLPPVRKTTVGIDLVPIPPGDVYIGRTEVTQGQFAQFVKDTGYRTQAEEGGGAKVWRGHEWVMDPAANYRNVFPGEDRPVVAVSYDDAFAFTWWLTHHERSAGTISQDELIRMPSGEQWERAARGGTRNRYAGTNRAKELCAYGNVPDASAAAAGLGREVMPCDDGVGIGTAKVASYKPNGFGLFDMSGNVWEWVSEPGGGNTLTVRGGSWSGSLSGLLVTHHDAYPPSLRGGAIGFRVAMTAR
jgi:formylglycine-generating enzyme required for sulfatase activity